MTTLHSLLAYNSPNINLSILIRQEARRHAASANQMLGSHLDAYSDWSTSDQSLRNYSHPPQAEESGSRETAQASKHQPGKQPQRLRPVPQPEADSAPLSMLGKIELELVKAKHASKLFFPRCDCPGHPIPSSIRIASATMPNPESPTSASDSN